MAVSEKDKELIQTYRDSLWVLIDRLHNYGYTEHTSKKVVAYARKLEKLHAKKHTHGGLSSLMDTMSEVEGVLEEVYEDQEGFERLYLDWDDIPFTVSKEAFRLRDTIPGLGYRGIYEKFEAARFRETFDKAPVKNQRVFMNRLDKLADLVEDCTHRGTVRDACADLLVAIREVSYSAPDVFELEQRQLLAQCYGNITAGYIRAAEYLTKMEVVSEKIDKTFAALGLGMENPYNFRSLKISDYLLWREQEVPRIERLYTELMWSRIRAKF